MAYSVLDEPLQPNSRGDELHSLEPYRSPCCLPVDGPVALTQSWVPGSVPSGSLPSLFCGEPIGTGATYSATDSWLTRVERSPMRPRKKLGTSVDTLTRSRFGLGSWVTVMVDPDAPLPPVV